VTSLALLQLKVSVNDSWLDYFIIGVYFLLVLGIGAVLRNKIQTSEDYFLSRRSAAELGHGSGFPGGKLGGPGSVEHESRSRPVRAHAVAFLLDRAILRPWKDAFCRDKACLAHVAIGYKVHKYKQHKQPFKR